MGTLMFMFMSMVDQRTSASGSDFESLATTRSPSTIVPRCFVHLPLTDKVEGSLDMASLNDACRLVLTGQEHGQHSIQVHTMNG